GPHYRLDHAVQYPKEIGREIMFSRSLGACGRGGSCCRYHSLLPGAREIALLLLLLDEGVRAIVLTHDRFTDVRNLASLVQLTAQKGEFIFGRRLECLDLRCHLRLERHLAQYLIDRHKRRCADAAQVTVFVVEQRPRRDHSPRPRASGQACELSRARRAVEEAGRGEEVDAREELSLLLVGHQE